MSSNDNNSNRISKDEINLENVGSLQITQDRANELQKELDDIREQMNDANLEIEAVASAEERARLQCERVLHQLNEDQIMQNALISENAQITTECSTLKKKISELESRNEMNLVVLKQQEALLGQFKIFEQSMRGEISSARAGELFRQFSLLFSR